MNTTGAPIIQLNNNQTFLPTLVFIYSGYIIIFGSDPCWPSDEVSDSGERLLVLKLHYQLVRMRERFAWQVAHQFNSTRNSWCEPMNNSYGKILIVDDDEDILQAARMLLRRQVDLVQTETNPEQLPVHLSRECYDVILLDMNFTSETASGEEGLHWLNQILETSPSTAVVMITAFGDVELAVRAMKRGATDFILKPWHNERLIATVRSAISLQRSRQEAEHLRSKQSYLSEDMDARYRHFIGRSAVMQQVFDTIEKVATTDANVLILGENGTGKELVARALHRQSNRSDEVFITVDMGAITETLFESELFGYVKGAFTDAKEDRPGRFEVASGGTLFLDEIGNLSPQLQAKLLTVLQNREVIRVGSTKSIPIDVRLICATNQDISTMVANQQFRQDLLYRINTVEIQLPPLRERTEDIPLLAEHFLEHYKQKYNKDIRCLSQSALTKLETWKWPGNVRELQHAVERAVILSDADVLGPEAFPLSSGREQEEALHFASYELDQVEKSVIRKVLQKHQGNISKSAAELGLTRAALYRRLEKYGL